MKVLILPDAGAAADRAAGLIAGQLAARPASVLGLARTELASREEVERLGDHYEARLEEAGFFFPPTKAEGMRLNLRNMWGRLALTRAEVQTLHGMLRQILFRKAKDDGQGDRGRQNGC